MLNKSCRGCGKVGKALCDTCTNQRKANPAYSDALYLKNRQIVKDEAWRLGVPCWLCGLPFAVKSDIDIDHKVSLRDGGSHQLSNLAVAHRKCNRGRFRRKAKEKPAPVIDSFRTNNDYLQW